MRSTIFRMPKMHLFFIKTEYAKNLIRLYTLYTIWYDETVTNNNDTNQKGGERVVADLTAKEATNIILKLTQEGWDANKINEFIVFIETHRPSEDEAMNILKNKN